MLYLVVAGSLSLVVGVVYLLYRRRAKRIAEWHIGDAVSGAAEAAILADVAEKFLHSLGKLTGGLLVLPEVSPFSEYMRLRSHSYEEILDRDEDERELSDGFDRRSNRWNDCQKTAIGRLEEESPALLGLLSRRGVETPIDTLIDFVLVTQLKRLMKDPIEKNHGLIVEGFLVQPTKVERSDKQVIKDFFRYMDETDLLPDVKEIAARLCVIRAMEPMLDCSGTLSGLFARWTTEWSDNFPGRFIDDPQPFIDELQIRLLEQIFARLGRKAPKLTPDRGIFKTVLAEYELDRYQETLDAGRASTISEMLGA